MFWNIPLAVIWQPIASPLTIGAGAVALGLLAGFASLRIFRDHPRAAVLLLASRWGVIAAVSVMLLGPSREIPQSPRAARARMTILVDTSESMRTGDCQGSSRIGHVAREVLSPRQVQTLQEHFDVEVQGFHEGLHPLSLERLRADPEGAAVGRATHLSAAVTSAVSRLTTFDAGDALLLISDGRDTEDAPVQPAAALAASRGVPIYTVGVGGAQSSADAAILAVPMQDSLLPGEPGGLLVKIFHSGLNDAAGWLRITGGGETQRLPVRLQREQATQVQATISREEPGQYEFEVTLEPVAGETELSNNSQTVFVEVMKRRIRVLLLEGEPFWDTKFIAQSLRKDEQVELTQITQVGTVKQELIVTRAASTSPRTPQTRDDWAAYDVVVLGRRVERLLDGRSAASLASYVRDSGGQVVFSRGPAWEASTPAGAALSGALGVLEPVVWGGEDREGAPLELTASGRTAAWFAPSKMNVDPAAAFRRLPGLERTVSVTREKSGALVLARLLGSGGPQGDAPPAIARMPVGRGQVVAILGEGLWRWSLLPPELQDLRGFYDTFWSNLIRWLALGGDFAPGQQASVQLSRTSVRLGDELIIDVAYRLSPPEGADPQLTVTNPDGETISVPLHELPGQTPRYRAEFRAVQTGVHQAAVRTPGVNPPLLSRKFNAYEVNLERLQTSANFLALRILAEHSGGAMFDAADAGDLREALRRHRESTIVPPQLEYLWDQGVLMTLLLLWAGGEWLLRRMVGLW